MIGKKEILEMTSNDLENYLNTCVCNVKKTDKDDSYVKGEMISEAQKLFNSSVQIYAPYYTNREIAIKIGQIYITFKVSLKITDKTVQITRLKRRDVKEAGKFKFNKIDIKLYNPLFEKDGINKYKVKLSPDYITGGGEIILKYRKVKFKDMLTKDFIKEELEAQDKNWSSIRDTVVLNAAQPILKDAFFKPEFNKTMWDNILKKTEEVNKELIDQEIEKILTIKL